MLDLQHAAGNRAVVGLLSGRGSGVGRLQRLLLIGEGRISANFIENKKAEIQKRTGQALAEKGIVIKDDEWPGIIDDLKTLASGKDEKFGTLSEAIKFVLAQRGDPRGAGATEKAENEAAPEGEEEAAPGAEEAGEKGDQEKKEKEKENVDLEPWRKFAGKKKESPAANAGNEPVFEYFHDRHGKDKHFGKSLSKGAQWDLSFEEADALMLQDVIDNLPKLLANTKEGGIALFYFSADLGKRVAGKVKGLGETSCYTVQIDVDRKKSTITYHGYPETNPTLGLGTTVKKGL